MQAHVFMIWSLLEVSILFYGLAALPAGKERLHVYRTEDWTEPRN